MKKLIEFQKDDHWRLGFHLMPISGWLNDPNGLSYFKGHYHVFFQYSPGDPYGGLKLWGHYRSKDLIHWEYLGVPLEPMDDNDRDGVYSGSALIDDEMHVYYTGNIKLEGDYNYITDGRRANVIYTKSKDGIHFETRQQIIGYDEYPDNLTCHVRDPKVWMEEKDGEKNYYMVLGARTLDNVGVVLIYESKDRLNWSFVSEVTSDETLGYMWECPDVFEVDGQKFLSISPQGVEPEGILYQNTYQSGYFNYTGDLAKQYELGQFKEWDRGFDFYAPQTFEDEQGRRILLGWMGAADTPEHYNPTIENGWQHALTIPREICIKDSQVLQRPVVEMEQLRNEVISVNLGEYSPKMESYEMLIENRAGQNLSISINDDLSCEFHKDDKLFTLRFLTVEGVGQGRGSRSVMLTTLSNLRVYVDTSSVEIFINDGEEVFTTRFYPEEGQSQAAVSGDGCDLTIWSLKNLSIYEAEAK